MLSFLLACVTSEPAFVSLRDLDKAMASGDTASLCAGLVMKDTATRVEAAAKLKDYGIATDCLCERLQYDGRWDAPILQGLEGVKDVEKVGCVGTLLDDPAQPERPELTAALLKIPAARARLLQAAELDTDVAVRIAAMPAYRSTKDAAERAKVVGWLATDTNPTIRAAAAATLFAQPEATDALRSAVSDPDAVVRAAALSSLQSVKPDDFAAVACAALMTDAEPAVRLAALGTMRATRDADLLACLRKRANTEESDADVRAGLLRTLASSAAPEAAKVLCDTVPYWVKTYVSDAAPSEGDDILKAQNNRDFENSYDCAQAASRQGGGYTCAGRAYVNAFFRDVGGKVGVPSCGGKSRGASAGEIVF